MDIKKQKGGLAVGPSHANGGIRGIIKSTGEPIEFEGGEIIITKKASEKHCETLSKINQDGGGVAIPCNTPSNETKFEDGGKVKEGEFIARYSGHIQDDIKRGWSSWNFGQEGIFGTEMEIELAKEKAIENDSPFYISGFELWGSDIKNADIRELYPNYWVLVDNTNGFGQGIFGIKLKSKNLSDAIEESKKISYTGDGDRFNPKDYDLVKSVGNIHIFKYKHFESGGKTPYAPDYLQRIFDARMKVEKEKDRLNQQIAEAMARQDFGEAASMRQKVESMAYKFACDADATAFEYYRHLCGIHSDVLVSHGDGFISYKYGGAETRYDGLNFKHTFEHGGRVSGWEMPSAEIYKYAVSIKKKHPELWAAGGNIYGNQAFENLGKVIERGYWLKQEEPFYKKWQSFKARHAGNFRLAGVIANLKWLSWGEIGEKQAKQTIEEEL